MQQHDQSDAPPSSRLLGQQLDGVVFVHDYIQLQFDDAILSAFSCPAVQLRAETFTRDTPGYRDALCRLIARRVVNVSCDELDLSVQFDDGATLVISCRPEDHDGPEAAVYHSNSSNLIWVFRAGD